MNTVRNGIAAWDRFLFRPQSTSTLAVFRIAFGVVVTLWTASQLPNLYVFYGPDGLMPIHAPLLRGQWGLPQLFTTTPALTAFVLVLLAGSIALTLGYQTRLAAVIVFLGLLALERRNPLLLNSGDILLRNMAFFLMLAPAGASLSLDRWRSSKERFWEFPARAPWALRLLQVQLSLIYLSTVWAKLQGNMWREGTAVAFAMRITDITRFPAPGWVGDAPVLTEMMTFGTLALELSIGLFVWNRKARPWVLGLGVAMHVGIEISIMVGFFSMAILTLYLVFLSPDTAERLVLGVRDRLRRLAGRADPPPGPTDEASDEPVHTESDADGRLLRERDATS